METVEKVKIPRASRLSREPVRDRSGEIKTIYTRFLTAANLEFLLLCYEHYVPIPYAAAITGRNDNSFRQRCCELKRGDNPLITLAQYQLDHPKQYQNEYQRFVLTKAGEEALLKRGKSLPLKFGHSSSSDHDAFADDGLLSLRLGIRQHSEILVIDPAEILSHAKESVQKSDNWHAFPIKADHTKKKTINPDYFPLGIIRSFDAPDKHPFFVFEFETGANRVSLADYPRSSIVHKLLAWLDVLKRETYHTHLALPNLYVIFICGGIAREETVLDMIGRYIPRQYQPFFLVKTFIPLGPADAPNAHGWMLESDFSRVGKPFNLLTSELD